MSQESMLLAKIKRSAPVESIETDLRKLEAFGKRKHTEWMTCEKKAEDAKVKLEALRVVITEILTEVNSNTFGDGI